MFKTYIGVSGSIGIVLTLLKFEGSLHVTWFEATLLLWAPTALLVTAFGLISLYEEVTNG